MKMRKRSALTIGLLLFASALTAQPAPQGPGAGQAAQPRSPEILSDGKVAFRLLAPAATTVTLGGDFPIGSNVAMARDDTGVWSVKVGPLKADFYSYFFTVDGVRTLDWRNVFVMRDGARYASWLRVPGPEAADYQVNDVPHGTVAQVWYPSPTLGMERRMYVYTPPGYETGSARYPVLYLLHGGGGDEAAWTELGCAPQILDNLIAQRRSRPMIVVMTNGNGAQSASQNFVPLQAPPARPGEGMLRFPESLVKDVIPFVDATFRTQAHRENRAVVGLSMGGAQALYAGLNNLEVFASIGALSGGFPLLPGVAIDIPTPANAATLRGPDISRSIDPAKYLALHPALDAGVNARLRLFYLAMGLDDGLITTHGAIKKLLQEKGVKHTLVEVPGYGHEWKFWRLSLRDLCSRLFPPAGQ
jgi:enterochelin esterase family protein